MDLYSQNILDHYKAPRNKGTIKDASVKLQESNYSCGDSLSVHLKIKNNIIKDIKFTGGGCAISQAAMSIMSERIIGKNIKKVREMKDSDIIKMLGIEVTTRRLKCGLLGLLTIKNAILKYQKKAPIKWGDVTDKLRD